MKPIKYLSVICLVGIITLSGISKVYAKDEVKQYGIIHEYEDQVSQKEKTDHALIQSTIRATTDQNGLLALPQLKDSQIKTIETSKGTLETTKEIKNGSICYYVLDFQEALQEVELTVSVEQKETYQLDKAKQKGTFPGGVSTIKYKMKNTAPVHIEKYSAKMAVKENFELYEIVDYDPEEEFDIQGIDGIKYGTYVFGEIKSGDEAKLALNINQENKILPFIMWPVAILISAFFLYKNRELLTKAKEAQIIKKTSKEAHHA